jgi:hypothetical protein
MKKNSLFIALVLFSGLLMFQACKKDRSTVFVDNKNNTGNKPVSHRVGILSAWTNQAPQKQSFTIDASTGGWIQGAQGCKFYFPADVLLDKNNVKITGNVDIELREYMTKGDMFFSGVTVTSGNQLLESGGMFYLMARKNGQDLKMKSNPGFIMDIPATNTNTDQMDFWFGEPNGKDDTLNKVNWVKADTVAIIPKKDTAGQGGNHRVRYFAQFDYFQFGYCNIDRESWKFKTLISKFRIKMPNGCNDTNSTALLLFKDYNCCAWCYWVNAENRIMTGYSLPLGEAGKVIVYKKTGEGDDDLEYAIKEFTFTDVTEVEVTVMTKCTKQDLENFIKAL